MRNHTFFMGAFVEQVREVEVRPFPGYLCPKDYLSQLDEARDKRVGSRVMFLEAQLTARRAEAQANAEAYIQKVAKLREEAKAVVKQKAEAKPLVSLLAKAKTFITRKAVVKQQDKQVPVTHTDKFAYWSRFIG